MADQTPEKRFSKEERKERKRAKRNEAAAASAAVPSVTTGGQASTEPDAITTHTAPVITSTTIASAVAAATSAVVPSPRPEPVAPAAAPVFIPSEENLPHLCCSVCLSFPEAEVLQCHSGHILCRACHDRVCIEQKPTCPTCRTPIDALKPIRNVALEQTVAVLPVECPNGCSEKLTRGALARHLEHHHSEQHYYSEQHHYSKQHLVMEHMLPTRRKDRKVLALLLPSPPSSLLSPLPA